MLAASQVGAPAAQVMRYVLAALGAAAAAAMSAKTDRFAGRYALGKNLGPVNAKAGMRFDREDVGGDVRVVGGASSEVLGGTNLASLLRDGFEDAEAALQALDALRTRLPVPQRVVRFVRGSEFEDVEEEEDAAQNRRTSFPRARTFSSGGADDDESLKFAPEAADDFLTDAAPLGQGMDDSALFACRDGGKLFFTSSCRVAEQCAYAGRGAPDADASRPAIVARTILYQKLDGARDIALEQGDEIWAATIDGRDYFNVVMADDTDRGLRHVLEAGGVTDLAAIGVDFERVE